MDHTIIINSSETKEQGHPLMTSEALPTKRVVLALALSGNMFGQLYCWLISLPDFVQELMACLLRGHVPRMSPTPKNVIPALGVEYRTGL